MRMIGDFTVYPHYIFRIGAALIVACAVCRLGYRFFTNFNNICFKFWSVDISSEHPKHPDSFYLGLYACFQFPRLLCLLVLWLICFMTIVQIVGARLHKETPCTVMSASLRFFTTTDSGHHDQHLSSRFNSYRRVVAGLAFVVVTFATPLPANEASTGAGLVTILLFDGNLLHIV